MQNIKFIALKSLLLFSAFTSSAESIKIATIDTARILNESSEAKTRKAELEQLASKAKKEAESKRASLQSKETKLKEAKIAEDSKAAEEFRNEAKQYSRYVKDTEEDLKKKFVRLNRDLTDKVMRAIVDFAKKNQIDLILDKGDKYKAAVLYGDKEMDVTDQVIELLD